jgi:hypothetical protein
MKYLTDYEGRYHFVIDTNSPHYATTSKYSMVKMPNNSLNWKEIVDKMRNDAVDFLVSTKPGGGTKSKGGKSYIVKKTKYFKTDVFQMAVDAKHFLPLRGQFNPVAFDQKSDLRKAAIKYAMCKNMKKPKEDTSTTQAPEFKSDDVLGMDETTKDFVSATVSDKQDPTCYLTDETIKIDDVGFGYLFESETEAAEFADYTYEMHFLYSQISKSDYLGYPLLGQDAYFKAVAYNMKLVGSLASQRAQNYGEVYALYQEDWEKRIGDYNSLGEAGIGSGSRNIKYGKQFYKAFGLLDFDDQVSRDQFDAIMASSKAAGGFNTAELSALNAKKDSALRTRDQTDKINAYNKQRGDNKLSLKRNKAASAFMKKLNSPLAAFSMNKLGGGSGYGDVADALSSLNKNIKGLNKRLKRKKNSGNAGGYTGFKMPKSFGFPSSSGSSSSSGTSLDEGSAGLAQHMNESAARKIIEGLNKGKSLNPNEDDNLWIILSKAYKRNYSRVLLRANSLDENEYDVIKKSKVKLKDAPNDSEKAKLKQLLEAN